LRCAGQAWDVTALVPSSSTLGWGPLRIARSRLRTIMIIAMPIVGGMVSQNLLNLIDTLMVSRLGKEALAAVGLASQLNFLSIAKPISITFGRKTVQVFCTPCMAFARPLWTIYGATNAWHGDHRHRCARRSSNSPKDWGPAPYC
jgi:hypothetical protein